jgi:hypothetical protein
MLGSCEPTGSLPRSVGDDEGLEMSTDPDGQATTLGTVRCP